MPARGPEAHKPYTCIVNVEQTAKRCQNAVMQYR